MTDVDGAQHRDFVRDAQKNRFQMVRVAAQRALDAFDEMKARKRQRTARCGAPRSGLALCGHQPDCHEPLQRSKAFVICRVLPAKRGKQAGKILPPIHQYQQRALQRAHLHGSPQDFRTSGGSLEKHVCTP
ncbi:MAG: hypothetical protein KA451_07290 [Methyloversatilis sp.]|nr:hypothetical protein [Methyloversatilis sp.]